MIRRSIPILLWLTLVAGVRAIRQRGGYDNATELLEKALGNKPLHWKANLVRAQCLWPLENADSAEWPKELAAQFPIPHLGILETLAAAQANAGDFHSAVRTLENALSEFPAQMDEELSAFHDRLASRLALYQQQQPYREAALERRFGLHVHTYTSSSHSPL